MLFRALRDFILGADNFSVTCLQAKEIQAGDILNIELNGLWESDENPISLLITFPGSATDGPFVLDTNNYVAYVNGKDIDVLRKNVEPIRLKI